MGVEDVAGRYWLEVHLVGEDGPGPKTARVKRAFRCRSNDERRLREGIDNPQG
jgi:hypothetical protein